MIGHQHKRQTDRSARSQSQLKVRQVFDLVVYVVEQDAGVQLVRGYRLERELVGLAVEREHYFFLVGVQGHLHHVAFRELEGLNGGDGTFMVLFWSARRCDQLPPFELIMYAPWPTDPNTNP